MESGEQFAHNSQILKATGDLPSLAALSRGELSFRRGDKLLGRGGSDACPRGGHPARKNQNLLVKRPPRLLPRRGRGVAYSPWRSVRKPNFNEHFGSPEKQKGLPKLTR